MSRDSSRWAMAVALPVVGLLAALALPGAPPAAQAQGRGPNLVPDQYIVVFKDGVANPGQTASEMAQTHGLGLGHVYGAAIKGYSAFIPPGRLRAVQNDPRVKYVEQDQVVTVNRPGGKPGGGGSTPPPQPAQSVPSGVKRIGGPLSPTANIDGVDQRVDADIAIIDTGIQTSHPDLNVVGGANFTNGSSYEDGYGHGTHVSGTAAALDNGIGVVGVAPGARLWAVKVLGDNGSGFTSWVIAGVDWVADTTQHPSIAVANMSLGGGYSAALNTAVENAIGQGVVFAVAAGNESADVAGSSPASAPSALTVSAINDGSPVGDCGGDTLASFSNYGRGVDIAAPGVSILSTYKGSSYATLSGTSMATPHVTGAVALYRASHPGLTPDQVRSALLPAASPRDGLCGFTLDRDSYAEPVLYVGGF